MCRLADASMDQLSSPTNTATSPVAARTSSAQPPTYTTAGTLYNPNSSQPLQAPARRGRSFKWTHGSGHSDLTFLPKSVIANLPFKGTGNQAQVYQQYTPLQQNYDRAVSPPYDPEQRQVKMIDQALQVRSGNTPAPISLLLADSGEDKSSVDGDVSDESGSDSDFGPDPLAGMTVKSLHNLASYPNPNQKRAQKALVRGVKATMNGYGVPNRSQTSTSSNGTRPVGSPAKGSGQFKDAIRPTQTDPAVLRGSSIFGPWTNLSQEEGHTTEGRNMANGTLNNNASYQVSGSGPGGPRPLTAGPPGHRQYRPSTFDSTFKALQVKSQENHDEDEIASLADCPIGGGRPTFASAYYNPFPGYTNGSIPTDHTGTLAQKSTGSGRNDLLFRDEKGDRALKTPGCVTINRSSPSLETTRSVCDGYQGLSSTPWWNEPKTRLGSRFKSGTDVLTDEEIKSRNAKNEAYWYAGSDLIGKTTSEAMLDARYRELERSLGVIGDKRPTKGKVKYKTIEIDEANRMSTAEHAKPLINMAFTTLLRCVEEINDHETSNGST